MEITGSGESRKGSPKSAPANAPEPALKLSGSGVRLRHTLAFEAIFNQMTEGLVIFDPDGNLLDMNPAALAIHGFDNVQQLRRHLSLLADVFEIFDLEGNPLGTDAWPIGRALRGETFKQYDVRVVRRDTGKSWIGSYGGAQVLDDAGSVVLAIVTLRDVTEQREAEEELALAKKRIETTLTATEVGVWHWDVQQNRMVGDSNLLRLFGIAENTEGVPLERYIERLHEEDSERVVNAVDRVLTRGGEYSEEYRIIRPGGELRWILARGRVETDHEGKPVSFPGVAVDVTERRRAEEALRESDERFRVMADGLPFIVWVHDAEGRQEFVNRTFTEFFGVSGEDMTGDTWQDLMHPDDSASYLEEFLRCTNERVAFRATVRVRRADGEWRTMDSHGRPRIADSGEFKGFVGASIDVTERLANEKEIRTLNQTLERRVRQRTADLEERNRELQHFAYIASHDLREPLRKIQTFADLLMPEAEASLGDEASLFVRRMRSAASRMEDLLSDLVTFSRIETHTAPFRPIDVEPLIANVMSDYDLLITDLDAEVEIDASGLLDADATQIRQLLSNLIGNAMKFRRDGVKPLIRVLASISKGSTPVSEDTCRIVVEDNGIGIDAQYFDRIFEPFERLHGRSEYEGTGMGLAICRRIVRRHRGTIAVDSRPGEGCRFVVTLPVRQPVK